MKVTRQTVILLAISVAVACMGFANSHATEGKPAKSSVAKSHKKARPSQTRKAPRNSATSTTDMQAVERQVPFRLTGTPLSLADAIAIGLRDNRSIKAAYISRVAQKFDLRVMENRFTPKFSLRGGASYQKLSGISTINAEITPTVTTLLPTGATFGFAWVNTSSSSDTMRQQGSVAEISLVQPLLRGGGIDVNLAPVRNARLAEQSNRLRLRATVSETIGQIIFSYRQLLWAQEELKLAHGAVNRANDLLEVNRSLIAAGRMAEMDIVQTEADIENQNIRVLSAIKSFDSARLKLLDLLALDLGTKIIAQESTMPSEISSTIAQALPVALAERPDYVGQQIIIAQNKLGIVVAENERFWDLSLFARGKFGEQRTYGVLSDTRQVADFTIGASFSIPIGDIQRDQPLVQATSSLRISELHLAALRQAIELQLRDSLTDIAIRWKQIKAANRARDLAVRAVDVEKEKLKVGRSSNFQVKAMENDLRSSESQLLTAVIGYLNALTLLDIQLGTALKTWRIDIND